MSDFGIGSVIGSAIGAATDAAIAKETNQTNLQIAAEANQLQQQMFEKTMQWQKNENAIMRQREDTAVQRRQADLAAAGINPLLAGSSGASASGGGIVSPPSVVIPTVQAPQIGQYFARAGDAISQSFKTRAEIDNIRAGTNKVKAETRKVYEDTLKTVADTALVKSQTDAQRQAVKKLQKEMELIGSQIDNNKSLTRLNELMASIRDVEFAQAALGLMMAQIDVGAILDLKFSTDDGEISFGDALDRGWTIPVDAVNRYMQDKASELQSLREQARTAGDMQAFEALTQGATWLTRIVSSFIPFAGYN